MKCAELPPKGKHFAYRKDRLLLLKPLGLLVFQVNYWNSNVNEVQGVVIDQEGKVVHRLFGKWHEGLYCGVAPSAKCIWRPGEMVRRFWATEGREWWGIPCSLSFNSEI